MPIIERLARENSMRSKRPWSATASSATGSAPVNCAWRSRREFSGMIEEHDFATRWRPCRGADREQFKRASTPPCTRRVFDHDGNALVDPARLVWGLERACLSLGVRSSKTLKSIGSKTSKGHSSSRSLRSGDRRKVALATNVFPSLIRQGPQVCRGCLRLPLVTER